MINSSSANKRIVLVSSTWGCKVANLGMSASAVLAH